jgi:hypothetical protein
MSMNDIHTIELYLENKESMKNAVRYKNIKIYFFKYLYVFRKFKFHELEVTMPETL